jgi:hypothetical protein
MPRPARDYSLSSCRQSGNQNEAVVRQKCVNGGEVVPPRLGLELISRGRKKSYEPQAEGGIFD